MKILFILHSYNINGVIKQNLFLTQHLLRSFLDVEIVVAAPDTGRGSSQYFMLGVNPISFTSPESLLLKLKELDFSPDVVFNESLFSLTQTPLALIESVNKHIVRVHEELPKGELEAKWYSSYCHPSEYFEKFPNTHFLFVCKNSVSHYRQFLFGIDYSVVPGCIDEGEVLSSLGPKQCLLQEFKDKYIILQLGTLYERKGGLKTLEAFSMFLNTLDQESANHVELVFCGARGATEAEVLYEEEVLDRVRTLGLESNVKVLKTTDNPYPILNKSSLLTLHSSSECYPTVILEALFLGKPVVSSDVGGISELLNDESKGKLFKFGDVKRQADLFREFYLNRGLERMKKYVRHQAFIDELHSSYNFNSVVRLMKGEGFEEDQVISR